MKNISNRFIGFVLCLVVLSVSVFLISFRHGKTNNQQATKKCLIISDIHFSPLFGNLRDSVLKKKLIDLPITGWKAYFESNPKQMVVNNTLLFQDANYAVLSSGLANMKKQLPHPAFIVIAGDFIWHNAKPADLPLKKKTIQFIAMLFKENFPGTPVIPAIGNNDTYGDDYALQNKEFLNDFADAWSPNLPQPAAEQLKAQGYYNCKAGDINFMVINSALLNNGAQYPQAANMLAWLRAGLTNANNKNVWIISHIPPGNNTYSNSSFWNPDATQTYINDVVKHAPKIRFIIASHTHFNDFKVFYNTAGAPVSFMRVVPSVCSNHGNNPSFEVAELNPATGSVTKEINYYLNLAALPKDQNPATALWNGQVSSSTDLLHGEPNAANFSKLISDVKSDQTFKTLSDYTRFYTVGTKIDSAIRISQGSYMKYLKADSLKANN
jgi:hypothetical protein